MVDHFIILQGSHSEGRLLSKTDREGYTTAYRYTLDGKTASILYGDGTHVEMEYDALRRLVRVKDWLGETAIGRDALGRPERIRDHRGRETSYEWGKLGERRSMTYPDGRKAAYGYDENLRLTDLQIQAPGKDRTFYWDGNAAALEEKGSYGVLLL